MLSPEQPALATVPRLSPAVLGWWLGGLGVLIFALTIPMTRLASGSLDAPQLPAVFVAIGRAALAGLLAAGWLLASRIAARETLRSVIKVCRTRMRWRSMVSKSVR